MWHSGSGAGKRSCGGRSRGGGTVGQLDRRGAGTRTMCTVPRVLPVGFENPPCSAVQAKPTTLLALRAGSAAVRRSIQRGSGALHRAARERRATRHRPRLQDPARRRRRVAGSRRTEVRHAQAVRSRRPADRERSRVGHGLWARLIEPALSVRRRSLARCPNPRRGCDAQPGTGRQPRPCRQHRTRRPRRRRRWPVPERRR